MGKPETQEEKYKTMTEKPVSSLICRLAVPTIISMLVTSFYNMADTFFVARIGTSATAAVGVSFALMAIIQAFGFFCGHGSGNYISRQLGAQNFEDASRMSATGFVTAFVLVDRDKEIARLTKEKQACEKDISFLEGKLNNPGFVSKAPEKVVNDQKAKLEKAKELLSKIESSLAAFNN